MRKAMKKVCLLFILALLLPVGVCPNAFCLNSEIDCCVARLEKRYGDMKDLSAEFEQETHLSSIKQVKKGEGKVFFKKVGKMLWEYSSPEVQKIILDGTNLWFYMPEEKQAMKNNFSTIPSHIVVDLFRGAIKIQQKFTVTLVQPAEKNKRTEIVLQLIPIIYDPTVTKVALWVDPETYTITKSLLEDEFGTKTILEFKNIKIDGGLDDKLFKFVPPPDVDIFEPPKL